MLFRSFKQKEVVKEVEEEEEDECENIIDRMRKIDDMILGMDVEKIEKLNFIDKNPFHSSLSKMKLKEVEKEEESDDVFPVDIDNDDDVDNIFGLTK